MDKQTLEKKALLELKEYLIITLYLWLIFGLFVIYKSVILAEHHLDASIHGFALINALALGKIMLIARAFPMGKRFEDAPLIYPTLIKATFFTVVLFIFKLIEEAAVAYFHHEPISRSLGSFAGGRWWGILSFVLIMWVILIPFVGFGELQRVLGEKKLTELFFGAHFGSKPQSSSTSTTHSEAA